jgi:hypothetical protein
MGGFSRASKTAFGNALSCIVRKNIIVVLTGCIAAFPLDLTSTSGI